MRKAKWFITLILVLGMVASSCAALGDTPAEGITVPVITDMKKFTVPETEAMALVKDMKCGWNLGNTFDAYDGYTRHATGTGMETSWVHAVTTRELIAAVKAAGFNAIRIPVSWHNHVDEHDRIDAEWIGRVREVAGWALDEGMYVIVNVHHDNDPSWFYPDNAHYERSAAYLTAVWTQMAEAFADCGDHLILESMNEPRLVGTAWEWSWDSSSAECREAADCINRLNSLFVETVRAQGGNNATRWLSVPAYCAAPWYTVEAAFQLPEDPAGRLIVAAHAYTPYNFALNTGSDDRTFNLDTDQDKKSEITWFLDALYKRFVVKGVPVLMDEFGALDKNDNVQDRVNFTAWYVASASARGITCFWWDNHNFTGRGERFGLIRRSSCEWVYPDIVSAIMQNCLCNRE